MTALNIITALKEALDQKTHPFRFFVLATQGQDGSPKQRTVVLRDLDEDLGIWCYTDSRSAKVSQIDASPRISALFYHREKKLQVVIEGKGKCEKDPEQNAVFWNQIPNYAKKEYTTQLAPGTIVDDENRLEYLREGHHFSRIRIQIEKIDCLQLGTPHQRYTHHFKDGKWHSQKLIP